MMSSANACFDAKSAHKLKKPVHNQSVPRTIQALKALYRKTTNITYAPDIRETTAQVAQ